LESINVAEQIYPHPALLRRCRLYIGHRDPFLGVRFPIKNEEGETVALRVTGGDGTLHYIMLENGILIKILSRDRQGKYRFYVPTHEREADGETLVYTWIPEEELQ
jgi:hypothetical protein